MGVLLPLKRTTPTRAEFVVATKNAWAEIFGRPPSVAVVGILHGQFAFETGHGKSCWWFNLGNHRTGPINPPHPNGYIGDYTELKTADEYINGVRVIVGGYFRAYRSLEDGALGHLEFLAGLKRYEPAWNHLISIDSYRGIVDIREASIRFVRLLKSAGYFTGNEDEYARGVASIAAGVVKDLAWEDDRQTPTVPKIDDVPMPWGNVFTNESAFDLVRGFFTEEWADSDRIHLARVIGCRYDCVGYIG